MAGSRVKIWTEEPLLYSDLNDEFDNVLDTSDQLIGTPRSESWDMNGFELILDLDGDTSITADTNDRVDLRIGGTDVLQITESSGVTTFTAAATNTGINLVPNGTGAVQVNSENVGVMDYRLLMGGVY